MKHPVYTQSLYTCTYRGM